eukprot:scaffold26720_cov62-Phaeocystis_antarctica.AAC.1
MRGSRREWRAVLAARRPHGCAAVPKCRPPLETTASTAKPSIALRERSRVLRPSREHFEDS